MPEPSPTTPDVAGVTRTATGEIASPPPMSTQDLRTQQEQIVRPPPTPTKPEASDATATEKTDGKETRPSGKSLINEKSEEPKSAPTTYADFKVPEGFELDKEVAGEAGALFKELNLSQDNAQKLVDFYVKQTREAFEAPFNAYVDKRTEWRDQINADPDMGGQKLNGVRASIGKLIESFGDASVREAFKDAMDYTGAGDNPAVVRGLWELSKRLTEGGPVRGSGPSVDGQRPPGAPVRPSAAQAIYPNLPSSQQG